MLWKKDTAVVDWVTRFTVGEDYRWDTLLIGYDIIGTRAHAEGLFETGIFSLDEIRAIDNVLVQLTDLVEKGLIKVTPQDEDCHTVIEGYLTKELGDIGKKIHTGRSRNDQVLTALRLFMRDGLREIGKKLIAITDRLCVLGDTYKSSIMPGYTHYQRAMPTTAGLWALGFAELMVSDLQSLLHALGQINTSPLGSAAGYGVPLMDLPREKNAERLGFASIQTNVTATQLSRGKLELHAVHALIQVAATFNRIASDLILYNTTEYGFVELPVEFCTGSSIMPQKKNPDVLELVRANYHRLLAEMQVLLTLPANLPSGYHRDLQLTKEAIMRSILLCDDTAQALLNLLPGVTFNEARMKEATSPELFATQIALEKVLAGIPFRDAYRDAAKESEEGQIEVDEEALKSYLVEGFPGQTNTDHIREHVKKLVPFFNS
ncbi:MAG: argininosuccinate lyase [Rhodothermaceae bacterium]|nr:argininosuccinate lyase [Rhodothermaceae bacterium]